MDSTQRKRPADQITEAEEALGKLAHEMGLAIEVKGWHRLIDELRGQSDVTPTVRSIPHKAGRLLDHLRRRGAAVPMATQPWDLDRKDAAITRGSHQSSHGEREFVARRPRDVGLLQTGLLVGGPVPDGARLATIADLAIGGGPAARPTPSVDS